jgi:oligoendopeptidase F
MKAVLSTIPVPHMHMNSIVRGLLLVAIATLPIASGQAVASETLYYQDRAEIPQQYTWDLGLYFKDQDAWDASFAQLESLLPGLEKYRGRVGESPRSMASAIAAMMEVNKLLGPLYVNAHQKMHLLRTDELGADQSGRILSLNARVSEAVSFIEPEIAALPPQQVAEFSRAKELQEYRHYLDNIWRLQRHYRSPEVEEVIAGSSLPGGGHVSAYESLAHADIQWPTIEDENGEEVVVSPGQFGRFMTSTDRDLRQRAFEAHLGKIEQFKHTQAATLGAKIQRDVWLAQVYRYPNSEAAALSSTNVPPEVMATLVATVHDNVDKIAGYDDLRRRILGYDKLQLWDRSVPLISEAGKTYTFEEAWALAMEFWRETFGDEFAEIAQQALDNRWVDVYSNEGKRSGAYSWGTYRKPYYLMLNWKGDFSSVSTLVHEMGHSVHGVLASRNQSYLDAGVGLFVAEVGSVASQSLFGEWMLERTRDPAQRKLLLDYTLTNIRDIFVRQIFFHEWESRVHAMAEAGEALTAESMGQVYLELSDFYYGKVMQPHPLNHVYWARISHFYRNFYVWKYATSFAAGEALAARFRSGDKGAAQDYLNMLKLGGSVYPLDVLQAGGVDMTDPTVIRAVMDRFGELQQQLEQEFDL